MKSSLPRVQGMWLGNTPAGHANLLSLAAKAVQVPEDDAAGVLADPTAYEQELVTTREALKGVVTNIPRVKCGPRCVATARAFL
jgi:hypothetical protein